MGCLVIGGTKFYVLAAGDKYPDPHSDYCYQGAYVVFPFEDNWIAQIHRPPASWIDLSEKRFTSECEAFGFVYKHYVARRICAGTGS